MLTAVQHHSESSSDWSTSSKLHCGGSFILGFRFVFLVFLEGEWEAGVSPTKVDSRKAMMNKYMQVLCIKIKRGIHSQEFTDLAVILHNLCIKRWDVWSWLTPASSLSESGHPPNLISRLSWCGCNNPLSIYPTVYTLLSMKYIRAQ